MKENFSVVAIFLFFQFTILYGQDSIKPVPNQYHQNILKAMPFYISTPAGVITSFSGGFEYFVNENSSLEVVGVGFSYFSSGGTSFSDQGSMFRSFSTISIKLGFNRYLRLPSAPNFSLRIGSYIYAKLQSQQIGLGGLGGFRINIYQQKWFLDLAMGLSVFNNSNFSSIVIGPRPIVHVSYAF